MKLFADKRKTFPDPRLAMSDGIVDMSDDVSTDRLVEAYSFGIFPWPHPELPILWYSPEQRGVLDFKDLHVPRSLKKYRSRFRVTFNTEFSKVIRKCAEIPRRDQAGTWITDRMVSVYERFHLAGYAHSVEVWQGDELVGGIYGVYVAGVFSGESMFHTVTNASKVGLVSLLEALESQGLKWMDIQMVTPILETFGGKYIDRIEFLKRLEQAKLGARPLVWPHL